MAGIEKNKISWFIDLFSNTLLSSIQTIETLIAVIVVFYVLFEYYEYLKIN